MVGGVDRGAPEGHDAVAHVFVDGAAVAAYDEGEAAEDGVEQGLELGGLHGFRQLGEAAHVAKHDRELAGGGGHAVAVGVFHHFVDQLGRHVGAKQLGQLAFGPAFHQVAVAHVERKGERRHDEGAGQRQHQAVAQVEPEIEPHHRAHHAHTERDRTSGAEQRQGQGQHQPGRHEHHQLVAQGVVGLGDELAVEQAGNEVGMGFHAGVGFAHRGHAQVEQAGGGGAHQHNLVLQLARRDATGEQIDRRHVGERSALRTARAAKRHQGGHAVVHRNGEGRGA